MSNQFPEYKGLNLPQIADDILDFWKKHQIFQKSISSRAENQPYLFFEGPPSANGLPGIHHVMARTIKDIFCRYKTQKGFKVDRKAGWDTHGLPVELGVEKALGITKEDIGSKISVTQYNKECKKAVMKYTDIWNELTEKIGYWVDTDKPYITYTSKYIESVWWLLSQIYKKDLLYKGYTIQPYSPKAGTGLSSHELNQPGTYRDVTDTTVVAQFKVGLDHINNVYTAFELSVISDLPDLYFLAWTTTPWTLPSNTALTVGSKIEYVLVSSYNQYTFEPVLVVLAKDLVSKQFSKKFYEAQTPEELNSFTKDAKKIPYQILGCCLGKDLVGIRYEQLIEGTKPYENPQNAFRVISGDFVTTQDGTGIVHTAPTFGADDALAAKQANPEVPGMLVKDIDGNLVPLVDLQGKFIDCDKGDLQQWSGKYVKNEYYPDGDAPQKSVDVEIAIFLKTKNRAFHVEKYVHSYPHCWRTDKPILYYPLDSWFIKVTAVKDRMADLNKQINWKPKSTGEGRFGNWLSNANDWNLSRSRFWGIPLPIWRSEDKKHVICIDSVATLKAEIYKSIQAGFMKSDILEAFQLDDMSDSNYDNIDLHKNIVDQIVLVSEKGTPMYRESDLIDVWFDSGAMPYAQWHYPFEHKAEVENLLRKADFIAEGVDQTRGWFYTLHAIATLIFDDVAYKNVVSNGLVLDKNGQKMSKRLGNAVDPFTTLSKYGPDATRWYMISNANPWDNLKFDLEGIVEVQRKFFGTLYNTYSFFTLYANIDSFTFEQDLVPLKDRTELDQWIISELHSLIEQVTTAYETYEPTKATRLISDFTQEYLSNWYVRRNRRRFWKGQYNEDKVAAYQTLYTCLLTVSKLAAPVAPFFMDRLYKDLNAATGLEDCQSVHLSDFPLADKSLINKALESKMQKAQEICSLALSLRQKEKIKVRQPLQRLMVPVLNQEQREQINAITSIIASEINVKEVQVINEDDGVLVKKIKPNFKSLGPRFGKQMKNVAQAITAFTQEQIREISVNNAIDINIEGNPLTISIQDVEITSQDIEGWLVATNAVTTVALDITLNQDLINEGIARELVNRIQNLRKDSALEVTDRIDIIFKENEAIQDAIRYNEDYIKNETLAQSISFQSVIKEGTSISFDTIETEIFISKN